MILPRPGSASGGTRPRAQRAWRARPASSMGRDRRRGGLIVWDEGQDRTRVSTPALTNAAHMISFMMAH